MKIESGKTYRIKGNSPYFAKKYGDSNPTIVIEGKDTDIWSDGWMHQIGNPACMSYSVRSAFEGLPIEGEVYYGKVGGFGELVHESELEEIEEAKNG